jgi:hypothetical protein
VLSDRTLFLVFTKPVDGMEDEYNKWYDDVHVHDVARVPGVVSAQRYDLAHPGPGGGEPAHRHLAIYELEGDPAIAMDAMMSRFLTEEMPGSDALDLGRTAMAVWRPRGSRVEAKP